MSEELNDEVEALNSIYGDGSLVVADDGAYILQLPGDEASSLKLKFPLEYPATEAPEVLGTHHSSGGKMGAGARDLRLFREALSETFHAGEVCLFDAVEEFTRKLEEEKAAEEEADEDDEDGYEEGTAQRERDEAAATEVDLSSLPAPPWTQSEVVVDMKSTFIAHVAPVTSPEQAQLYVAQLLAGDKRIRTATHNITAWRIRGSNGASYQDCDDDGEAAAGGRVLRLMQLMDVWDVMVVVTRWYGGVKLGPRRFAVINAVARDGFVRAGFEGKEKEKGKKK
ncbi:hypothetical protein K4F52_000945 [Lecanicillium sp. MT-2017a]|nr:hypothetical protein K4F52_000945 [Lecanicillium sp. MT-2017a]